MTVSRRKGDAGKADMRWLARVNLSLHGCWEWNGGHDHNGYAVFYADGRQYKAHRWGYEHFVQPVPKGLDLDHLCRNRGCVNPDHLEPVTRRENLRRGVGTHLRKAQAAARTHCFQNHELTPENVYVRPDGVRACRVCLRRRHAAHRARKKAST
jgi:hypothetical protein